MTILKKTRSRTPRYTKALPASTGRPPSIPTKWEKLKAVDAANCEPQFIRILRSHQMDCDHLRVVLRSRYVKGRPWSKTEFDACFRAWSNGIPLTIIAAALDRNPQDMIFRLLDECHKVGRQFTEKGRSLGSANWTREVEACASELFDAGLPAWRIAALFGVDFEHVEKAMFSARPDYGHRKRNPFGVNTDHKYFSNRKVLRDTDLRVRSALDAFAGSGKTTRIIRETFPAASILAIENDQRVFAEAQQAGPWGDRVTWDNRDNLLVLASLLRDRRRFDLVDLDPFVSCHEQLQFVWPLLKEESLLFVTFGGEYRRSFISSNRKAIASRYGFLDFDQSNSAYLEEVPYFFLGWVGDHAATHGMTFEVQRAVRYANNCRFWLRVSVKTKSKVREWRGQHLSKDRGGIRFRGCDMPRFREIRAEMDKQKSLFV
jgi:hypothetical protein